MRNKGFSLIEIMIGLVVLAVMAVGVFYMMGRSSSTAAIEQEQRQISTIVDNLQRQFVSAADYSGVSSELVVNSKIQGTRLQNNALVSNFNTPIDVRPARTFAANDSFDMVYQDITAKQCTQLIPAVASRSSAVFVGSNTTSLQDIQTGRISNEAAIATQCNGFGRSGQVVFRFYTPRNTIASVASESCLCTPETQTQALACGSGQNGQIIQQRSSTCVATGGACAQPVWGDWAVTSETCRETIGAPITPDVLVPVAQCTPATDVRNLACPTGQAGVITQRRSSTCASPTAQPVWSDWAETVSSCAPVGNNAVCRSEAQSRTQNCPAGSGSGHIIEERSQLCTSANDTNPSWTPWLMIENTCTNAAGWTCQPSRETQTTTNLCAAGYYGGPVMQDQSRQSTCSSSNASPTWPNWTDVGAPRGSCTACPGNVQSERWEARSAACPSGQTGTHTWEAHQRQVTSYNCPAGTLTQPSPTVGAWEDTGATRGEVNSCQTPDPGPGNPGGGGDQLCTTFHPVSSCTAPNIQVSLSREYAGANDVNLAPTGRRTQSGTYPGTGVPEPFVVRYEGIPMASGHDCRVAPTNQNQLRGTPRAFSNFTGTINFQGSVKSFNLYCSNNSHTSSCRISRKDIPNTISGEYSSSYIGASGRFVSSGDALVWHNANNSAVMEATAELVTNGVCDTNTGLYTNQTELKVSFAVPSYEGWCGGPAIQAKPTCYNWSQVDEVYGPGSGCNMEAYPASYSDGINRTPWRGATGSSFQMVGAYPWTGGNSNNGAGNIVINDRFYPCNENNVGEKVTVLQSCGGWQPGLEGWSGYQCTGPTGNNYQWTFTSNVVGAEVYRGTNPSSSPYYTQTIPPVTAACSRANGGETATVSGYRTLFQGTGSNRVSVITHNTYTYTCQDVW